MIKFIEYFFSHNTYYDKTQIPDSEENKIIRRKKPTIIDMFLNTLRFFVSQYGSFMVLLRFLDNDFLYRLIDRIEAKLRRTSNCEEDFFKTEKYNIYYSIFKKYTSIQKRLVLGLY